jgi:NADH dehydrogenase [ubiquinone] 1 alpha subcomplex assembly factor 5
MSGKAPHRIFDRKAYRQRRIRPLAPDADPFLARETAEQIAARIASIHRRFECALDLNSRKHSFATLKPEAKHWTRAGYVADQVDVIADDEFLPFADGSFDLVTSVLALHSVNDLPGTLIQIRRVLKPDGVFLAALFGGETLRELRFVFTAAEVAALGGASPRIAPFADVRDLGGLLQRAGFALPVADLERTTVRYTEPMRLLTDLRSHGETNVLQQRPQNFLSRRLLQSVLAEYRQRFGDEQGRVPATFDIVYLIGWAPHASQPKPLQPGSAKTRLADALKQQERKSE